MEITVATLSDVGRVRTNNEDFFLSDPDLGLFVVCDGMGGHNAGEVASRMACEIVQREVTNNPKVREKFLSSGKPADARALRRFIESAVVTACKEVYKRASKSPELAGMGTTLTLVLLAGHHKGIMAHVGDSRLYVARAGALHQLSEDHTYVNELVRRGALSREQAKHHPQGNVLSRALGVQPTIPVDTMIFDIDPNDTYVLCSDGLYNYFQDPAEIVAHVSGDIEHGVHSLVQTALERGGHDNCTSIVFRVGSAPATEHAIAAEQRIAILKRIPIFAHLSYNELVKVVGLTQMAHARAGEVLIEEGALGDELFVLLSGDADVFKGGAPIARLAAGAHIGEMALIDNAPRSATVRARTDASLLVMRREEFFGLIRSEPVIATKLLWSFVQVLSGRLRETNDALQGARHELAQQADFEIFMDADEESSA